MPKFYLGVVTHKEARDVKTTEYFWCLPLDASIGDVVLLYCPRVASDTKHGVFAEAVVTSEPKRVCDLNRYCSGYGAYGVKYFHVKIDIVRRFEAHILAADMKNDRLLSTSAVIRKNFQGTTFELEEPQYKRILVIGSRKAERANESRIAGKPE